MQRWLTARAPRITLRAKGSETASPLTCSVDIGRAIYDAEAHTGVGGTGAAVTVKVTGTVCGVLVAPVAVAVTVAL